VDPACSLPLPCLSVGFSLITLQERTRFGSDLAHQDHLLAVLAQLTFVGDPQLKTGANPEAVFSLTAHDRCLLVAHRVAGGDAVPAHLIPTGSLLQFLPIESLIQL